MIRSNWSSKTSPDAGWSSIRTLTLIAFSTSRIIFKNFIIIFDGTKIHHSVGVDRSVDQLYFGIHYLVSLSEARLSLHEYARFRGMRCEVQIQTILHHAWAETSHDIVYHPLPMQGFGTRQFADIEKRLEKIMNRYLLPAGYEFQKVQHDYERLLAGKDLFDRGTLEALEAAKDNNERHDQLRRIREDLLPFYDDASAVAPEVIRLAAEAIKKARYTQPIPVNTAFGDFDGHTAEQVASEALQLIDDLRYAEIERTFHVLCDLYLTARSNEERKRIFQSFEALACHDLEVWKQVGFGVQKALYDAIRSLEEAEKQALRSVITGMCGLFLNAELEGATWHFNSVSLTRAAVTPSSAYEEFRNGVLEVLFGLYRTATSLPEKLQSEQALSSATRCPMDGGRDDLIAIVLDNTLQIVQFFAGRVDHEPFRILQHIEHEFLWLYRRSKEMTVATGGSVIPEKAQTVVSAIERFRDRANKNDRFVKFKTLVGFESVFPLEWDNDSMDVEGPQRYRETKIKEYAASVTADNADEWLGVMEQCAAVRSNDVATFGGFLKQLAARDPTIVIGYLEKREEILSNFIPAILAGFAESDDPRIAPSLANKWIDQGRHLHAVARYLHYATNAPEELVIRLGKQVIKQKDAIAAIGMVALIIERQLTSLVDSVLLPSIQMLTDLEDARWINGCWFGLSLSPFLAALSEEQSEIVLTNLTLRERVEHQDERLLCALANKYPRLVLQFFKRRIDRKESCREQKRYEAVPYHMAELGKVLARDPKLVLELARSWYSFGDPLFTYTGGRLLERIFPQLDSRVRDGAIGIDSRRSRRRRQFRP